jgi:glycosyltransferase involved in cell wall biosynthesis
MVVHNYYPIGEPRVQRQAEALAQAGSEVDVICLRNHNEPATQVEEGIHIYRLPVHRNKQRGLGGQFLEYLAFFFLAFVRLTLLHFQRRYQVVQVHNLPDFLVFVALIPRLMGAAVILDLHDLMPEFSMSRFGDGWDSLPVRLVRLQERLSCRFAHHVITVTELWRESLVERGTPAAKCSVVMNVADDRIFHQRPPVEFPSNGTLHMIYHGNLTYRYGLDLALYAVAQASAQVPGLHLTIHGRGEFLADLKHLAAELNLEEIVNFSTHLMPMDELPHLLASADVGLVPYRRGPFADGILPTKLMEYAALGLPAIAARTPAIEAYFTEDMVDFFEAGDVNALADRIVRLSRDANHRAELAHNIHQFNKRYNWAAQRTEYLALVARLNKSVRSVQ